MWLRKHDLTGASGIGPHEWTPDRDVTEVPDELGRELLTLDPGGYSVAEPPAPPEPAKAPEPAKVKAAARHGKAGDGGN